MKNTLIVLLPLMLASCVFVDHGPADIQVLKESRPLGNAKELVVDLKLDVGQVEVVRRDGGTLAGGRVLGRHAASVAEKAPLLALAAPA